MPNHVTNILTIKGTPDQVRTVRDAISQESKDADIFIDFEKIVPMPNELLGIHSGIVTIDDVRYDNWREVSKTTGDVILGSDVRVRDDIKMVGLTHEEIRALKKKYGAADWYNWNIAQWGTKWNAYDQVDISPNSFSFNTAWSTPSPIINAISIMFPDVIFELDYADEDIGSNVGRYVMQAGELLEEESFHGTAKGMEVAIRIVYGMSPLEYIDDRAGDDPEYAYNLANRLGIINTSTAEEN